MKESEFESYNKTGNMPYEDMGQGKGYKITDMEWEDIPDKEIIYIPEYAYDHLFGMRYVLRENAYSKEDFRTLVRKEKFNWDEKRIDHMAMELFDHVDWQFPEFAIDEGFLGDDEDDVEYVELTERVHSSLYVLPKNKRSKESINY